MEAHSSEVRLPLPLAWCVAGILAVGAGVSASFPSSDWTTGLLVSAIALAAVFAYWLRTHDRAVTHTVLFGACVALVLFVADAWFVDVTRTVDVTLGNGPLLWRTPVWIPLLRILETLLVVALADRLSQRFSPFFTLVLTGIAAAALTPLFQEAALNAHWWAFRNTAMLLHTPLWSILGNCLSAICVAEMGLHLPPLEGRQTLVSGLVAGAAAGFSMVLAYAIVAFAV